MNLFFRFVFLLVIFHCSVFVSNCYSQLLSHTIYLIGDCGKDTATNQNLLNLQKELLANPNSTAIFLGDNIYPVGLYAGKKSSKKFNISEKKLLTQLSLLDKYKGNVFFVPGNHDWKSGKAGGLKTVNTEEKYIESYLDNTLVRNKSEANFLPQSGLPGPSYVRLNNKIILIVIDLQWWLHRQLFRKVGDNGNKKAAENYFFTKLNSLLEIAKENGETAIIAAHHPLFSNGHHGAKKQPLRFLINWTPLKIFGWLGLDRMLLQDIEQPRYKRLKKKLLAIIDKYENVIYAAGHEHNLQYYIHKKNHFIVSGSGSKLSKFKHDTYRPLYANDTEKGFFAIYFYDDGSKKVDVLLEKSGKRTIP